MTLSTLFSVLAASVVAAEPCPQQDEPFVMEPNGAMTAKLGYYPIPSSISPQKPPQVRKEPTYRAVPQYGVFRLGNGPQNETVFVVDEPKEEDWKIYIDRNRNGDLTDDGDGAWNKKAVVRNRVMYGTMDVTLRASYGSPTEETSSASYTLMLYSFADNPAPFIPRKSCRAGSLSVEGKLHRCLLVENDSNALFHKPIASAEEAGKTKPVWLLVDLNDDGKYSSGSVDIRGPFKLGESIYEAEVTPDGSRLKLVPTTKAALELGPKPAAPLLKAGDAAPDFSAEKWGGGSWTLSEFKGKVVVLDFWSTWCGPCQKSMPHLEQVNKAVKDQAVVILALCSWDEKPAYTEWMLKHEAGFTVQFAFDPSGKDTSKGIASRLYHVSGIPTSYIIDKEGKVAATIVGYDNGDQRLEAALKALGIKLD